MVAYARQHHAHACCTCCNAYTSGCTHAHILHGTGVVDVLCHNRSSQSDTRQSFLRWRISQERTGSCSGTINGYVCINKCAAIKCVAGTTCTSGVCVKNVACPPKFTIGTTCKTNDADQQVDHSTCCPSGLVCTPLPGSGTFLGTHVTTPGRASATREQSGATTPQGGQSGGQQSGGKCGRSSKANPVCHTVLCGSYTSKGECMPTRSFVQLDCCLWREASVTTKPKQCSTKVDVDQSCPIPRCVRPGSPLCKSETATYAWNGSGRCCQSNHCKYTCPVVTTAGGAYTTNSTGPTTITPHKWTCRTKDGLATTAATKPTQAPTSTTTADDKAIPAATTPTPAVGFACGGSWPTDGWRAKWAKYCSDVGVYDHNDGTYKKYTSWAMSKDCTVASHFVGFHPNV